MSDATVTIRALRERVQAFVQERDWEGFHNPKDLSTALAVEAGELLERFLWQPPTRASDLRPEERSAIAEELADVLIYGLHLANALAIDVSEAVEAKVTKTAGKYPVERFRGRAPGPAPAGPR